MLKRAVFISCAAPILMAPMLCSAAPQKGSSILSRNPFMRMTSPPEPPQTGEVPPLQQYPLQELKLTAIIRNSHGELFASVENPRGIGFKVVNGTLLGATRAKVIEIATHGILIEELTSTEDGQHTSTREIPLHPPTPTR